MSIMVFSRPLDWASVVQGVVQKFERRIYHTTGLRSSKCTAGQSAPYHASRYKVGNPL